MATDTPSLLELSHALATDDATKASFRADPEGFLAEQGYGDLSPDDLATALGHVADALPVALAAAIGEAVDTGAGVTDQLAGLASIDPDEAQARWDDLTAAPDDTDALDDTDGEPLDGLDPADLDRGDGLAPAHERSDEADDLGEDVDEDLDRGDGDPDLAELGGMAPAQEDKQLEALDDGFGTGGDVAAKDVTGDTPPADQLDALESGDEASAFDEASGAWDEGARALEPFDEGLGRELDDLADEPDDPGFDEA
jgi:hypothetical protein